MAEPQIGNAQQRHQAFSEVFRSMLRVFIKKADAKLSKRFEKLLTLPQFFRSHRSHIIHLNFVQRVITSNGWWVTFADKEPVPISKKNREELVRRLVDRSVREDGLPI